MKRILSLTLVAVMLLSALVLTACDPIASTKDFFVDLFGGKKDENLPPRNTITEEEWNNTGLIDNYTLEMKVGEQSINCLISGKIMEFHFVNFESGGMELDNMVIAIDVENGCIVAPTSAGWLGQELENLPLDIEFPIDADQDLSIGGIEMLPKVEYSELVYQEETCTYYAEDEETKAELYYENGVLVSATLVPLEEVMEISAHVSNVSSTTLDMTSYTRIDSNKIEENSAPAEARTTISSDEWEAAINQKNFTMRVYSAEFTCLGEYVNKINNRAYEEKILIAGQELQSAQRAIINGYFYELYDVNGTYYAEKTSTKATTVLQSLLGSLPYSELTYNEAGRYYKVGDYTGALYFYFEDGVLTKMVLKESTTGKSIFVFSDYDCTEIELPKYIVG